MSRIWQWTYHGESREWGPVWRWRWGWIRLIVESYHLLQVWFGVVCRCMSGDLMWTCLVWAEWSTSDNFWVPSHRFNSATGEQKGITQTIYTDSEPSSQTPNSLMPSAKLRSANLPFFTSLVWCSQASKPVSRTPSGHSNHYATQGCSNAQWIQDH